MYAQNPPTRHEWVRQYQHLAAKRLQARLLRQPVIHRFCDSHMKQLSPLINKM